MIHPIPAILPPPFKAHRACSSHAASARARRTAPGLNVPGRCKKFQFHFISLGPSTLEPCTRNSLETDGRLLSRGSPRRALSRQGRTRRRSPARPGPLGSQSRRRPRAERRGRAASCPQASQYLRHKVRRKLAAWKAIGASPKLLRWIKEGVSIPFLHGPPQRYHQGISFTDMTPDQFEFMSKELPRLFQEGGMESGNCNGWVSRAFLVPKPPKADGTLCWRIVVDLRHLNLFCQKFRLKLETLKRLRYLGRPGDYCFSIDLQDGFYAMGLVPEDRAYMTFEIPQPLADSCGFKNTLVQLCGLPMGWTLSPYYFVKMMEPVFRYLRSPMFSDRNSHQRYRRHVLHLRRRGCRLLPFMDDILFLCSSRAVALELREQVVDLLERVGLSRNPKKGQWDPGQQIHHLGLDIDFQRCEFRAPKDKLAKISSQAHDLLCRAARNKRSVPVKELAQLAGRAQFLYLAIPAARFYLRELHDVMSTKTSWSGHVKVTRQLRRDLEWWRTVPQQRNGRPIFSPVETAYLHTDSSSFGWGAVLNDHREARGFWPRADLDEHITFKELKAVRLAVETFLPQLRCRRVLLHEDNQAVVAILTKLTSRSPALMNELRKLWHIMDENDITIRPRYIQSAANIWADRLSLELDDADWRLHPRLFRQLDKQYQHTIDRFASGENAQLPRFNSRWLEPRTEAVDCLRLPDSQWRAENNFCHPPWDLLDDLVLKLQRSGAAATVVAPLWPDRSWHQLLTEMASEIRVYPPSPELYQHRAVRVHAGLGPARWSVVVFRLPCRRGCISATPRSGSSNQA